MPTRHAIGRSFVHLFPQEIYRHFHSVPIPYSANTANLVFGCESLGVPMMRLVTAAAILLIQGQPATASLLWNWSYSGAGVSASGTFTTNDTPDGAGLYQIVGITGTDNGATITGLQPTGTPIPGNEPYAVDNLVSAAEPRLTMHGFGFAHANGNYANPFYNGSGYFEYLSVPPYENGAGPERPVSFSAAIVPEPNAASLVLVGLVGLIGFGRIHKRLTNLNRYPLRRLGGFKGRQVMTQPSTRTFHSTLPDF
jgi:hypothetical protein